MQLVPNLRPAIPADPVVLPDIKVDLSPNAGHVKTGTPLKPTVDGWTKAGSDDDEPENRLYASTAGWGGEKIAAAPTLCIRLEAIMVPGTRYTILDVDDLGNVKFSQDHQGRHVALTKDTLLMS